MESLLIAVGAGVLYLVAYHTYGRWLGSKLFDLDPARETPATRRSDGRDYVPSNRHVVFGHHFTSIAGTGPIVGPAIAVIWGWLPALIWVVIGSIFMGAVHDFGALVMSLRNQGRTIGDFCGDIINRRVRLLFLTIIMFALWIVIAIFGLVIAVIFRDYPQSVFACWAEIPIAVILGWWVFKRGGSLTVASLVAIFVMYLTIWLGSTFPSLQFVFASTAESAAPHKELGRTVLTIPWLSPVVIWTLLLLIYAFIASTLPVHRLLQPRDFINSHQLTLAMGLILLGLLITRPEVVAPSVALSNGKAGVPAWMPFLFITIACGACSGFHCLVSSGCSSKQLRSEPDARFVGYGAMLLEGMLATLVIVACVAGVGLGLRTEVGSESMLYGPAAWENSYATWGGVKGLGAKLAPFVQGSANMLDSIPLMSRGFAVAIVAVFVASFAATTLDTATRLQRYVISELAVSTNIRPLRNIYASTGVAVGTGLLLAMFDVFTHPEGMVSGLRVGGAGAMKLWPLFGATNQLLAGLALLVLTVWLFRKAKPVWMVALPMVFMLAMTGWALVLLLKLFWSPEPPAQPNLFLFTVGGLILLLECWMVIESVALVAQMISRKARGIEFEKLQESA